MPRPADRIQKIIQVTKPTARIESTPPNVACAGPPLSSEVSVYVSSAPNPRLNPNAAATPSQTGRSCSRRSVRTR